MTYELLQQIANGTPGVMLVMSAEDLRQAMHGMFRTFNADKAKAIAEHRERPTMTREDAAKALNVTFSTLWRWAKDGYLVPVKIGTKVLYRASDIDELLLKKLNKD